MKKLAIPFSIAALALAACAEPDVQPAPLPASAAPIVPQPMAYTPGYGTVESVLFRDGPISSARGGTATGASGHPAGTSATDRPEPPVGVPSSSAGRVVRLGIRMQDGTLQWVDTDSDQFPEGTKVMLRSDHVLQKM
jgi:hypothetical protein